MIYLDLLRSYRLCYCRVCRKSDNESLSPSHRAPSKESGSRVPGFGLLSAEPIDSDLALRARFSMLKENENIRRILFYN